MKKALSLALVLALCLGLAVPALAADSDFVIEDGVLKEYKGTDSEVVVPDGVTLIEKGAFDNCPEGTNLTIPGSVELITWSNFRNNHRLRSVVLCDGVTKIDTNAFDGTLLTSIVIPASVTSIEGSALAHLSGLTIYGVPGSEAESIAQLLNYTFVPLENSTPPETSPQPDAPAYQVSDWAKDRVALAVETGLAAEGLGSDYRVNITRAQFAATAVKLYEAMGGQVDPAGENPFNDTTDSVIIQAAELGFVSGVGGGRFSPDALVTREQAAVMLSSVFTKLGGAIPAVDATTFADNAAVSGWARNAVAFMADKGIVSGVGNNNFGPQGNASIEQALLIALKMFEDLK